MRTLTSYPSVIPLPFLFAFRTPTGSVDFPPDLTTALEILHRCFFWRWRNWRVSRTLQQGIDVQSPGIHGCDLIGSYFCLFSRPFASPIIGKEWGTSTSAWTARCNWECHLKALNISRNLAGLWELIEWFRRSMNSNMNSLHMQLLPCYLLSPPILQPDQMWDPSKSRNWMFWSLLEVPKVIPQITLLFTQPTRKDGNPSYMRFVGEIFL